MLAAIDQWAKAWRSKDVAGYLAAYGEGFQPDNGLSRDDWARLRQQWISDKREIQLELHDIEVMRRGAWTIEPWAGAASSAHRQAGRTCRKDSFLQSTATDSRHAYPCRPRQPLPPP